VTTMPPDLRAAFLSHHAEVIAHQLPSDFCEPAINTEPAPAPLPLEGSFNLDLLSSLAQGSPFPSTDRHQGTRMRNPNHC
jgi:hypothetical protein